jgi:Tfp pilus assembly protein FimT
MDTWRMISITGKLRLRSSPSFSLLELLVVLGIISSLTLLGSLFFYHHLSETLLKTSAQEIASTLIWARRLAITKRQSHRVVFQTEKKKYWIEDNRGKQVEGVAYLKRNIVFADPELNKWGEENGLIESGILDQAFSFYPQGTAEGGSIYLREKNGDNWYTITVVPTTGKVRVYPGKH